MTREIDLGTQNAKSERGRQLCRKPSSWDGSRIHQVRHYRSLALWSLQPSSCWSSSGQSVFFAPAIKSLAKESQKERKRKGWKGKRKRWQGQRKEQGVSWWLFFVVGVSKELVLWTQNKYSASKDFESCRAAAEEEWLHWPKWSQRWQKGRSPDTTEAPGGQKLKAREVT